ncbi:MAG: hypothetical protein DRI61_10125 [Chloroflexi bacterium]|nr:MAG: hypothetical protein DRI61_10125 [Chloroflexota bacterium]
MIVLDCTLRDGGYCNDWLFSDALVTKYLSAIRKSGIDAIELGFRTNDVNAYKYANITDDVMGELNVDGIKYVGVMVNTNEVYTYRADEMFKKSELSKINLVRLATHFNDINKAEEYCVSLKQLGYTVTIQLMQAASKSYDEISRSSKKINDWGVIDVLYIADSFGGMNHDSIDYAYSAINDGWSGDIGFHAHNNKSQAVNNTLEAVDIGFDWVDGTLCGIGRGAGNAEIEYLLIELNKRGYGEYKLNEIGALATNDFYRFNERYKCKPSLPYYLSAEYDIHPMYVQRLLKLGYNQYDTLYFINELSMMNANYFSHDLLKEAINGYCDNNPSEI